MKKIFILFILTFFTGVANAEIKQGKSNSAVQKFKITFSGTIGDTDAHVSREIYLTAYDVYSITNISLNSKSLNIDADNKSFKKSMEIPAKTSYLTLDYKIDGIAYSSLYSSIGGGNVYRIENGQNVECTFYKDSIHFTGNGAEKLNLQTALFNSRLRYKNNLAMQDPKFTEKEAECMELNFKDQIELLDRYKHILDKDFYDYLFYRCLGDKNNRILNSVINPIKSFGNPEYAINYYKKNLQDMNTTYPETMHSAGMLMDFIYRKEKLDFELERGYKNSVNKIGANMLLTNISRKYYGKIRERLLILGLCDLPKTYIDTYSFLVARTGFSKESPYQGILNVIINNFTSNKSAYAFSLPDYTGKKVQLRDFKGKLIVLDFWFTGCKPCQLLAKQMAPIIDHYKGKNIVFVTINIDKIKNNWLNSLKTGAYSHIGNVNLYTDGLGNQHPIIAYYNISAYPKMLIIDKEGKLITAEPIRPIDSDLTSTQQFIDLIDNRL